MSAKVGTGGTSFKYSSETLGRTWQGGNAAQDMVFALLELPQMCCQSPCPRWQLCLADARQQLQQVSFSLHHCFKFSGLGNKALGSGHCCASLCQLLLLPAVCVRQEGTPDPGQALPRATLQG